MMRSIILLSALLVLSAGCAKQNISAQNPVPSPSNYSHRLLIGNKTLLVEIADTEQTRATGLSYRNSLPNGDGMLFEFGASTTPAFWMKAMNFNLDFIWIAQNKIIGITADVPAPKSAADNLPLYYPPSPVEQVLEVNAGWAMQNNIRVGDKTSLQ